MAKNVYLVLEYALLHAVWAFFSFFKLYKNLFFSDIRAI